jgi:hypothetical protein
MLGGVLLAEKVPLSAIFAIFAVPAVLAGLAVTFIRMPQQR